MIEIKTDKREQIIDITPLIQRNLNGKDGMAVIYSPHTTTAIIINEAESGLLQDILRFMDKLAPRGAGYMHDKIDNNADSHLKASLLGNSVVVPVENGRLMLGTWQRILFIEFDGPRRRRIYVRVI